MATNSTPTKPVPAAAASPRSGLKLSSQTIAIIISVTVALIITVYLFISPHLEFKQRVLALALTFSACFLLVYFSYEALIFKEINNIYGSLEKFKRKEFKRMSSKFLFRPDPLQRIKDEIYLLAERNQKEIEELKRLQAMRREFLADVSHELKTPIFAAQGFLHTLIDGAIDDERVRDKFLQKAARSLDGLDTLVQDLITISQLEKGVIQMKKTQFDLNDLGREAVEQLEAKARTRNTTIHLVNAPEETFEVIGDRGRIKQVLLNLIDNAIKYGAENGNIWLSFHDGKKKTVVTVRDDGPGIHKEHLTRIFERFYRIDKSRTKDSSGGGSGLGLAISKHIVEAHKSVIAVVSTVGEGTTMRFKLPRVKV
ncbi:sensor histidine kinase [Rufibacter glacialis]|uniref:histidine kinase n=1 Tax=Rufibacter glacialis TaxID=1259555 RepID=A0A5M8QMB3_9BACT|nr:ATP-binding protein [Rufibacter glacialis]KAA6437367.1 two-component sensor histidine kinase [Rufibacter glacialis]GGK59897.1 two-component sensor histidine kinase [Rufibacter glacialis]